MSRYQAHRLDACRCGRCRRARVFADIGRGILYALAAVGALVAVWSALVLVLTA